MLPEGVREKARFVALAVILLSGLIILGVWTRKPVDTILWGSLITLVGVIGYCIWYWRKLSSLGTWIVWLPLAVIVLSALGSYRTNEGVVWTLNLPSVLILTYMFLVFLVGRLHSGRFLHIFPIVGGILALGCIFEGVSGFIRGNIVEGSGFFSNPNVAACFMGISLFFCKKSWKWLIPAIILGIYFTGAHGTIFGLGAVLLVFLGIRDWAKIRLFGSKFILVSSLILLVIVGGLMVRGTTWTLYEIPRLQSYLEGEITLEEFTKFRVERPMQVIREVRPFGHGENPAIYPSGVEPVVAVHNVPFLLLDEYGPLAAVCWLFVMFYLVVKSNLRYPFILILVVSMLSNLTWQVYMLGPLVWYLWGNASKGLREVG